MGWSDFASAAFGGGVGNILASTASVGLDQYFNREGARDQMHFQKYMSNTAHYREVQDLIRAGLNPILSARYGGASTPGGAAPAPSDFASSAQHVQQISLQQKRLSKELEALEAQKDRDESAADVNDATADGIELDNERKDFENDNLATQAAILREQLTHAQNVSKRGSQDIEQKDYDLSPYRSYRHKFGHNLSDLEKALDVGKGVMDIITPGRFIEDLLGGRNTQKLPDYKTPRTRDRYKPRARRSTRSNRQFESVDGTPLPSNQ